MCVIRTEDLCKTYRGGTQALCGLDLEVRAGEVFGFLGPNGAGKSTTIQLLLNFIRPTTGTASLFGRPAADPRPRQRLGYLPESVNLHAYYSGRGLLEFYADPESPVHKPELQPERRIILYCGTGGRSALAAKTLRDMGYADVASLAGGFEAWRQAKNK